MSAPTRRAVWCLPRLPGLPGLTLACALMSAGCGGGDDDDAPATPPASEPSPDDAPRTWARSEAPQLVVSVVIEALDSETLERLTPALSEDGFIRRAMREGAFYPRAQLPFAVTHSAPAHAALYTGATQRLTGIVADALRDPEPAGPPQVRTVADSLREATARTARGLFPLVDKASDQPTADLLTQRLEVHEKTAWMLRSLLEE